MRLAILAALAGLLFAEFSPVVAEEPHIVRIQMTAGDDGDLAQLILDGKVIAPPMDKKQTRFDRLQSKVRRLVEASQQSGEKRVFVAELTCDYDLKYENVIRAISAVSSYQDKMNDETVRLIDAIKFAPPREIR